MVTAAAASSRNKDDPGNIAVLLHEAGITGFLHCATPVQWLETATRNLPVLLVDHANCEKKAASTALNLLYRYTGNSTLLHSLSRLAREELRHFEQVVAQMQRLGFDYPQLSASRYAGALHAEIGRQEPHRLVDTLLVGAYIEARSCERFAKLVPLLAPIDALLAGFYHSLLRSEARHYRDYLSLARKSAQQAGLEPLYLQRRIDELGRCEAALVQAPDNAFRFHSGVPAG